MDVRMNTRVGGTMITFIKEQVVGDDDADDADADFDQEKQASSNGKSSPVEVSRKRKRSGVEAADVPLGGRLAEIRRITQRYQERTD